MNFEYIDLKPLSLSLLLFLFENKPLRAAEIAGQMSLKTRAVDAAVTKALIRYGFVVREAKLTPMMKKEYNLISITEHGKKYIDWYKQSQKAAE